MSDLREKVARAVCLYAKSMPCFKICDGCDQEADAAIAECVEHFADLLDKHYERHDNNEPGYHEGARDALDIAEQAIRAEAKK